MESGSGKRGKTALAIGLAVLLALFACVSDGRAAEAAHGWWLVVRTAACAHGGKVLLGDIAEPRGDLSAADWKRLAARQLWDAPARDGRQIAFSRERLAMLLQRYAEDISLACSLPPQIVIQRGGDVVDGQELKQRVVKFLTEHAVRFGGDAEITDVHVPDHVFLPGAHAKLKLAAVAPELKPGRANLLFSLHSAAGDIGRRFAASAFLNVWKPLPVAGRGMCRRERLNLADVRYKRKNLAYNPDSWDGKGGPWRLARNVGIDQVIRREDLEPVPVIAKGEMVNLVFERPGIRLSVKVEALSDGSIGQAIQVRNLQSKIKITAKVRDGDTVIVR